MQVIGRHQILEKLGEGGMGQVFLAQDTLLGRRVAIKLILPEVVRDAEAKARFLREAKALAGLNHPNITILYEVGEADGLPYLVMEYIEGRSLRDEIAAGPLATGRLLDLAGQITSALEHAHAHGVLHRDIKSSNVLVTREGVAKVCDFGLAKFVDSSDETRSALTAAGAWVGTMHYAPPEALSGQDASCAGDIYSLGVMLYEMASGQLPFHGLKSVALVGAIMQGAVPPIQQRNPTISDALDRLIGKAMAMSPQDRFASAGELKSALREMAGGSVSQAAVPAAAGGAHSLAVLEFSNLSRDPESDWLGMGLAETLTADLKKLKSVRVVSRERVQAAARSQPAETTEAGSLAELGRKLGAKWVVAGSFQRAGNRLRITPRVVETASGEVTATSKVDGNWEDVFALQDRVVTDLTQALELGVDSSAMERIVAPETMKLEAYELYARGRKKFHELGKNSLEEARQCFEKAVSLDSHYQMAYSGLGATYAMRYIHRTDPDDLNRAVSYLERALELDPELGEPYPWLCYAYMRQGKVEQSIQAGRRGVRIQPDLVQAHYFLGAAYLVSNETDPRHFQEAADAFLRAAEVDPRWEPLWLCLAEIALNVGDYAAAERFIDRLIALGNSSERLRQFVGGEMMGGFLWLRRGDWPKARKSLARSLEILSAVDHMYREAFQALTACALSDLNLREGNAEGALAMARRALRTVKEFPRMLGHERVLARVNSAMAAAYAAAGDSARARELVREAGERLDTVRKQPQNWIWQAAASQLAHAQAVALARLGETDAALDQLEQAVNSGWRDADWLERDPELASLRGHERFHELVGKIRTLPPVRFEIAAS